MSPFLFFQLPLVGSPHTRADKITILLPVSYKGILSCPFSATLSSCSLGENCLLVEGNIFFTSSNRWSCSRGVFLLTPLRVCLAFIFDPKMSHTKSRHVSVVDFDVMQTQMSCYCCSIDARLSFVFSRRHILVDSLCCVHAQRKLQ